MRLNETEMVKLLPAWMQEDGSDKGEQPDESDGWNNQ